MEFYIEIKEEKSMAFKGWKKKAADFILAVTEPFRVKLELIEKNGSQRLQALCT